MMESWRSPVRPLHADPAASISPSAVSFFPSPSPHANEGRDADAENETERVPATPGDAPGHNHIRVRPLHDPAAPGALVLLTAAESASLVPRHTPSVAVVLDPFEWQ